MKQITLSIEYNKESRTLIEFLKTLKYVKVSEDEMTLKDLQNSLREVKLMRDGKLKRKPIESFLNELSD
jgi:hypothetical protein